MPGGIGNPQMWIAKSPDLIHWGEQRHFCGISSDTESWDDGRIGGGAVPFLTKKGWVKIYHAADRNDPILFRGISSRRKRSINCTGKDKRILFLNQKKNMKKKDFLVGCFYMWLLSKR